MQHVPSNASILLKYTPNDQWNMACRCLILIIHRSIVSCHFIYLFDTHKFPSRFYEIILSFILFLLSQLTHFELYLWAMRAMPHQKLPMAVIYRLPHLHDQIEERTRADNVLCILSTKKEMRKFFSFRPFLSLHFRLVAHLIEWCLSAAFECFSWNCNKIRFFLVFLN